MWVQLQNFNLEPIEASVYTTRCTIVDCNTQYTTTACPYASEKLMYCCHNPAHGFVCTERELKVLVDDIVDVILRIFKANGHFEHEQNVKKWFNGEAMVDFWTFFQQLTDRFVGLLQVHVVQDIHMSIISEFLKEGRLEKKGHVVHNWKFRWFVLTSSALTYFESRETMLYKVL